MMALARFLRSVGLFSLDIQVPYIENHLWRKKLANFANLEAFVNVFLHFLSWTSITKEFCPYSRDKIKYYPLP